MNSVIVENFSLLGFVEKINYNINILLVVQFHRLLLALQLLVVGNSSVIVTTIRVQSGNHDIQRLSHELLLQPVLVSGIID